MIILGGVFRDDKGAWLCGFSMRIEVDTIFKVEARAILEGLNLAWDRGFRQLELKCDNGLLVETILAGGVVDSNLTKIRLIYRLISRNWKVRIRYVPRTHNGVADYLSKTIASDSMRLKLMEEPPPLVRELLVEDYNGSMLL